MDWVSQNKIASFIGAIFDNFLRDRFCKAAVL